MEHENLSKSLKAKETTTRVNRDMEICIIINTFLLKQVFLAFVNNKVLLVFNCCHYLLIIHPLGKILNKET